MSMDKLREVDMRLEILAINRRNDISASEKNNLINEVYNASRKSINVNHETKSARTCEHYVRTCDIQCSQCSRWFGCRLCHDEDVKDHKIDRFATQRCRCRSCGTEQEIRSSCKNCGSAFSLNFCLVCRMWCDFDIFHCNQCGICRRGLSSKFVHCTTCDACMPTPHTNEECKASKAGSSTTSRDAICPICYEELFSSIRNWSESPCGHRAHSDCVDKALRNGLFQCPICRKCLIKRQEIKSFWNNLQMQIEAQPMPPDLSEERRTIYCHDCGSTTKDVKFHFLGMRCSSCQSFNTQ